MKTYIPLNGLSGVAIAVLPSIICIQLTFSDGLGGGYRIPSMMFSILMVAWKAASIWSTSRPRVLMMCPL